MTRVGQELAELARKTKLSLTRIRQHAVDTQEAISGRLTFTTLDGFAPLLTEPLAVLARMHPDLELLLDVSPTGSSIRKGEADIALTSVAPGGVGGAGNNSRSCPTGAARGGGRAPRSSGPPRPFSCRSSGYRY